MPGRSGRADARQAGAQERTAASRTRPRSCRCRSSRSRRDGRQTERPNSQSLVRFDTNDYSVPVQYAHRKLIVVATVDEVRLVYEDRLVARHRALLGAGTDVLRADPLPGAAGTQAGRLRLRPAAGELGTAGVLRLAAAPAGSGRSAARHAVVHPGAAAVGEVLPAAA